MFTPEKILPYLNIGRIIRLVDGEVDWGYGISINFHKKDAKKNKNETESHVVDAMVHIMPKAVQNPFKPAKYDE